MLALSYLLVKNLNRKRDNTPVYIDKTLIENDWQEYLQNLIKPM
jgi:hypothetical protein